MFSGFRLRVSSYFEKNTRKRGGLYLKCLNFQSDTCNKLDMLRVQFFSVCLCSYSLECKINPGQTFRNCEHTQQPQVQNTTWGQSKEIVEDFTVHWNFLSIFKLFYNGKNPQYKNKNLPDHNSDAFAGILIKKETNKY